METMDIIDGLCKQKGIAISQLEKDLGFGNGSLKKTKKGTLRSDRICSIARYFGTTPNYILGWNDEIPHISPEALQIALAYDQANERQKIGIETLLGIDFKKGYAEAVSSGSMHSSESIKKEVIA